MTRRTWDQRPRLKKGERVRYDGGVWKVTRVSECSATIVPVTKKKVTIQGRSFKAPGRQVEISPTSELERVGRSRKS